MTDRIPEFHYCESTELICLGDIVRLGLESSGPRDPAHDAFLGRFRDIAGVEVIEYTPEACAVEEIIAPGSPLAQELNLPHGGISILPLSATSPQAARFLISIPSPDWEDLYFIRRGPAPDAT
ncbi:MAG: hypothetical protein U1A27_13745 [Phycisphaerae bacterium]